jgi:hypothetical protein
MHRRGVLGVLTTDPLAAELGLTDDQKEGLRVASREIEEELAREIAKLRAKAKERLISELRADQQQKLKQIVGEDFDVGSLRSSRKGRP